MSRFFHILEKHPGKAFLAFAVSLTIARIGFLFLSDINLGPDETQYWFWSKTPAFGYFSKPPMIAWIIGATTGLFGDGEWAVRLASPLFHLATACVLYQIATDLFDRNHGFWAGTGWLILPGISFSSAIISTDVPLLFFWSLGIFAVMRIAFEDGATKPSHPWLTPTLATALLGLAMGFGFLSKYAMIYFPLALLLAAPVVPALRNTTTLARFGIAMVIAGIILIPNILWNQEHDFQTLSHTAANANWQGDLFKPSELFDFWGSQIAIAGPIVLLAFLGGPLLRRRTRALVPLQQHQERILMALTATPLLIVSVQAFISRAHANWAAAAYPALLLLAVAWLIRTHRKYLLQISHGLHLAIALALAIGMSTFTLVDALGLSNAIKRVRGWEIQGAVVAETAQSYETIMADDRELTGELLYYAGLADRGIIAWNSNDHVDSHYEAFFPFTAPPDGPILYVTTNPDGVAVYNSFATVHRVNEVSVDLRKGRKRTLYLFELTGFRGRNF